VFVVFFKWHAIPGNSILLRGLQGLRASRPRSRLVMSIVFEIKAAEPVEVLVGLKVAEPVEAFFGLGGIFFNLNTPRQAR